MAITLDVRADVKATTKYLSRVQRTGVKRATYRALNETVRTHRKDGVKAVAKELRLPQKNVASRFDKHGKKKADRATIIKANASKLTAAISVYMRGIPVIQIVSAAQKRQGAITRPKGGIRAAGGRRYGRVFIEEAPRGSGNLQALTRLNKPRHPVGVPKIGVRNRLDAAYTRILANQGTATFRSKFKRLMKFEIEQAKR